MLGSGQLGRMFAIAARRMGYRVHTFSPDTDTPTGQSGRRRSQRAPTTTWMQSAQFASEVDVVTFEFENVPAATAEAAGAVRSGAAERVDPAHHAASPARKDVSHRRRSSPYAVSRGAVDRRDLRAALARAGLPRGPEDRGFRLRRQGPVHRSTRRTSSEAAWQAVGAQEAVLEAFIDFERELSVVAARGADGDFVHYGAIENQHSNHILDVSVAPADVARQLAQEAVEIARAVLEKLDVVGVLCVEFFLTRRQLLINELAPRPHNSGHLTFDACVTSQFEQQLRAVCGLPLGSTELLGPPRWPICSATLAERRARLAAQPALSQM